MKRTFLIILFLLSLVTFSFAAEKYCGASKSGTEDGSSWNNKYACSDVFVNGSGLIGAGNTMYIDGEASGKVYTTSFVVPDSGTSGAWIYIKPGAASPDPTNHNGTVTLRAASGYGCIYLSHKTYVNINGNDGSGNRKIVLDSVTLGLNALYLDNMTNADHVYIGYVEIKNANQGCADGALVKGSSTTVPYVEFDNVYVHGSDGDAFWLNATGNDATYGRWSIHDSTITDMADDGLEFTWGGMDFYDNIIGDRRTSGLGAAEVCEGHHSDIFQFHVSYMRFWNNTIRNWGTANGGSTIHLAAIYYETEYDAACGNIQVYNNLFLEIGTGTGSAWAVEHAIHGSEKDTGCTSVLDTYYINNTFIGPWENSFLFATATADTLNSSNNFRVVIENNIDLTGTNFNVDASVGGNFNATYGNHGQSVNYVIDYNNLTGSIPGGGAHDTSADPVLDANYKPTSSSTSIVNEGVDLSGVTNATEISDDKDGNARGTPWDIGAYEYTAGATYTLTVTLAGTGTGTVYDDTPFNTVDCPSNCTHDYDENAYIVLMQDGSGSGSTFAGWSGDCSGNTICNFYMTEDRNVTATFDLITDNPRVKIGIDVGDGAKPKPGTGSRMNVR